MATSGRGSKVKGSTYENKIAKLLTSWWGGKFSRVPASGGLHWGADQRVAGDIIPPPEADFPFVIECKKREGWTMDHVLLNIGEPKVWWEQVVSDARRVKLVPVMFFSRNRAKDFVMLPYEENLYRVLDSLGGTMRTSVTIENIRKEEQKFDVIVTTFDSLQHLSRAFLKGYAENLTWDRYADQYKDEK